MPVITVNKVVDKKKMEKGGQRRRRDTRVVDSPQKTIVKGGATFSWGQ
jgi:hypothetical protein